MKVIKITAIWCGSCLIMNKIWKKYEDKYETISLDIDLKSFLKLSNTVSDSFFIVTPFM